MAETLGFRRIERSWVRDEEGWTSGGYPVVVHVVDQHDTSPNHSSYRGYDSRCGWCYLGANHSEAEHARKLAGAVR